MVRIVLGRLPVVHRIEIGTGIVSLDGLEETPEGILKATSGQRSAIQQKVVKRTTSGRFAAGTPFHPSHFFRRRPWVVTSALE